jgi:hypothetical protein
MADQILELLASIPFSARTGAEGKDVTRMLAERAVQRYQKSVEAQEGFFQQNKEMFTAKAMELQAPEPPMPELADMPPAEEDAY